VLGLNAHIEDTVPVPWRVDEDVPRVEDGGIADKLGQPRGRLLALLADLGEGVRRETIDIPRGFQVRSLVWREEPPLLSSGDLTETIGRRKNQTWTTKEKRRRELTH
jgi:hypothetical protein